MFCKYPREVLDSNINSVLEIKHIIWNFKLWLVFKHLVQENILGDGLILLAVTMVKRCLYLK